MGGTPCKKFGHRGAIPGHDGGGIMRLAQGKPTLHFLAEAGKIAEPKVQGQAFQEMQVVGRLLGATAGQLRNCGFRLFQEKVDDFVKAFGADFGPQVSDP